MYIIAGLGNPGLKYRHTRHNAGFDAIDHLAKELNVKISKKEKSALTGRCRFAGEDVLLVKPQTYMNNSGESIGALAAYYKVDPEKELIVLSDDVTLDAGKLRIRKKGSAGGHNGLKSIIAHCHTEGFSRIRIGVGKLGPGDDMITHVLTKMSKDDRIEMKKAISNVPGALELMISGNTEEAMNRYN